MLNTRSWIHLRITKVSGFSGFRIQGAGPMDRKLKRFTQRTKVLGIFSDFCSFPFVRHLFVVKRWWMYMTCIWNVPQTISIHFISSKRLTSWFIKFGGGWGWRRRTSQNELLHALMRTIFAFAGACTTFWLPCFAYQNRESLAPRFSWFCTTAVLSFLRHSTTSPLKPLPMIVGGWLVYS